MQAYTSNSTMSISEKMTRFQMELLVTTSFLRLGMIEGGAPNKFAESTGYDVLFEGKQFAPKAVTL